MSEMAHYIIR